MAAVVNRRKSLLPAGITAFYGDFESGDVVDLLAPDGQIVARGFVGHDAAEMPGIIGRSLAELPAELRHPVVHADDLIAVPPPQRRRPIRQPHMRTKESSDVRHRSAVIDPQRRRPVRATVDRYRRHPGRGAGVRRAGRRRPPPSSRC